MRGGCYRGLFALRLTQVQAHNIGGMGLYLPQMGQGLGVT